MVEVGSMLANCMRNKRSKVANKELTVNLMGGLGNQLFQFTFGKFIEILHDSELYFDTSYPSLRTDSEGVPDIYEMGIIDLAQLKSQPKSSIQSRLQNVAIRKSTSDNFSSRVQREIVRLALVGFSTTKSPSACEVPRVFISDDIGFCSYDFKAGNRNEYFLGYFQSYRFFENVILNDSLTRKAFENFVNREMGKWNHIRPESNVVAHIRRQDYRDSSFGLLSQKYYTNTLSSALRLSGKKKAFVISDEEPVALEKFLKPLSDRIEIIDTQDLSSAKVLGLLASFNYVIGANSTLSWWAATLGGLSKKNTVWFPSPWFKTGITPRYLFKDDWKLVSGDIWE